MAIASVRPDLTGPAIWLRCVLEPAVRADRFPDLAWPNGTANTGAYEVQIASDSAFSTLIQTGMSTYPNTSYTPTPLSDSGEIVLGLDSAQPCYHLARRFQSGPDNLLLMEPIAREIKYCHVSSRS